MARRAAWLQALVLLVPLAALSAWVVHRALSGELRAKVPDRAGDVLSGLPTPQADLARDELEQRVDGAADQLRADGCRRLVVWRFDQPPADAEALVFTAVEGARAVLDREAGKDRTRGPGDEAQVSEQAIYFRRGAVLVRLFLDPGKAPTPGLLVRRAEQIDRALQSGGGL
jgi:uncharacterized protein with LGFP repeats